MPGDNSSSGSGATTGGSGSASGATGVATGSSTPTGVTGSVTGPDDAGANDLPPSTNDDSGSASPSSDSASPTPPTSGTGSTSPPPVILPDDGGVAINSSLLAKCSGSNPLACHFGGSTGNYDVTVELGGASAGTTSVMAEISREMLGPVTTAAGQSEKFTMVVNVRTPEGQPVADVGNKQSGLDLYFFGEGGKAPVVSGIGYAAAASPIVVYLATDSTGCDQTDTAYAGWGQWLPQYFGRPISIANYGNSGVNSPGFAGGASYWKAIQALIGPKDFLLIELWDNDKADTESDISGALTTMITGAKSKGATPILMTPVSRALFTGNTVNAYLSSSTGANVPTIMKQLGQSQNVTVLDLTARTTTWLQGLGPTGWQKYFAYDSSTGKTDSTHLNQTGAGIVAGFIRDLIKAAPIPTLASYAR